MIWLVPISLFMGLVALYLGGMVDVDGGGPMRQILGLLVSLVLFVVIWGVLRIPFSGLHPFLQVALPTLLSVIALPFVVRIAYMVLGIRLQRSPAH